MRNQIQKDLDLERDPRKSDRLEAWQLHMMHAAQSVAAFHVCLLLSFLFFSFLWQDSSFLLSFFLSLHTLLAPLSVQWDDLSVFLSVRQATRLKSVLVGLHVAPAFFLPSFCLNCLNCPAPSNAIHPRASVSLSLMSALALVALELYLHLAAVKLGQEKRRFNSAFLSHLIFSSLFSSFPRS
jgi:hypothetical protein